MARTRRCAAAAAGALLGLGVLSACTGTTPNAAVVNGTDITQSAVLREMHALGANQEFVSGFDVNATSPGEYVFATGTASQAYTQVFASDVVSSEIQAALIHNEVVRRHIQPTPVDVAAETAPVQNSFPAGEFAKFPKWLQQQFRVRAAEEAALDKALGPVVTTNAGVKDFFTAHPEDFISAECVSQIIVPTKAEAAKIQSDIAAGARFDAEARSYSIDASAKKGGDLGCTAPAYDGSTIDVTERVIALNRLSDPVYVPLAAPSAAPVTPGWYLVVVRSRTPQALDSTASGRIQQFLQQESPVQAFVTSAVMTAKVSVNPEYGSWDPMLFRVASPLAPDVTAGVATTASP